MMIVRMRTGVVRWGLRAYPSNLNRLKPAEGASHGPSRSVLAWSYLVRPTVLTIAGSDCSGGAGIQADLKTVEANLGYAATVITAITAQNTRAVHSSFPLPSARVAEQLETVFADLDVVAVKTGMLADAEIVGVVARQLRSHPVRHYVCDPVMVSSTGFRLLDERGSDRLLRELMPLASLLTPNAHEAEKMSGVPVRNPADAQQAGKRLLELGARAVLVTGGHLVDGPATDILVTADGCARFPGQFFDVPHTHGSGCTLSSAIATLLARGLDLHGAVETAKRFVGEAIRCGLPLGSGNGPTDPFFFLHARRVAEFADDPP